MRAAVSPSASCTQPTGERRGLMSRSGGRTLRALLMLLGLGLGTYLVYRLGPGRLLSLLLRIGWHLAALGVIHALYQALRAAALSRCLLEFRVPYRDVLWIRISGEAVRVLTSTGPLLAELAKAWLLKRRGLALHQAFASTLSEILFYNLSAVALAAGGLAGLALQFPLEPSMRAWVWGGVLLLSGILLVAVVVFARRAYFFHSVLKRLSRRPWLSSRVTPYLERVRQMEEVLFRVVYDRPARFLVVVALEAAAHLLLILEVYWVLAVLGNPPPLLFPLLIETASKFISLIFLFVPLQLGVAEGAYAFVLTLLGLPAVVGVTLSLVRRLRSLLVTGIGLLCWWALGQRQSDPRDLFETRQQE